MTPPFQWTSFAVVAVCFLTLTLFSSKSRVEVAAGPRSTPTLIHICPEVRHKRQTCPSCICGGAALPQDATHETESARKEWKRTNQCLRKTEPLNTGRTKLCLMMPITSCVGTGCSERIVEPKDTAFIRTFINSLKETLQYEGASEFQIGVYLGADEGDPLYDDEGRIRELLAAARNILEPVTTKVPFEFVFMSAPRAEFNFVARMWWYVQRQSYVDGCDYFVAANDDASFQTKGWPTIMVETLRDRKPLPNVGLAGFDFGDGWPLFFMFHRTHCDIHGYGYPPEFVDWGVDNWINAVYYPFYRPEDNLGRVKGVTISNWEGSTSGGRSRYSGDDAHNSFFPLLVLEGRRDIHKYFVDKGLEDHVKNVKLEICGAGKNEVGCGKPPPPEHEQVIAKYRETTRVRPAYARFLSFDCRVLYEQVIGDVKYS